MKREIHRDIVQGTEAWLDIRSERITSTGVAGIFVKPTKKLQEKGVIFGTGMLTQIDIVVAEIKTGGKKDDGTGYTSDAMQNGKDLENEAAELYEVETLQFTEEIGFATLGKYFGTSPDRLVGNKGCMEIKCRLPHLHEYYIRASKTEGWEPKETPQIKWHMYITGREWCDFVSYNPDYPEDERLFIHRMELTKEDKDELDLKVATIEAMIKRRTKSAA